MDDLLENTTVIPLVQFLAHICRVVVSKVWSVFLEFFVRRRRRRCSISALKARRVASVKSFPLSVASASSSDDNNNKTAISASSDQK